MRKLRIMEHISLDGIIQAPGGPSEDGDYEYGGWSAPFDDPVIGEAIAAAHKQPFDLVLGRRTYDIWSGHWPNISNNPLADTINAATKYIATHKPESLTWGPVEDLGQDIVEGVRNVKATAGPDLLLWGSSTLTPVLLEQGLVDEVVLIVYPVLLGKGKRFFSEDVSARELALVSTLNGSSGVVMSTFTPVGPVRTGSYSE